TSTAIVLLLLLNCTFCLALWCYDTQYSCEESCRGEVPHTINFPSCRGLRQSPINIVTSKAHSNSALPPFNFIGHNKQINVTTFSLPQSVRLSGGGLPGNYRAANFHFHWGREGSPGSEHTIDGERLPMEMHIVHIKEPYGSLAEAEHDMAGIALLAFLFQVIYQILLMLKMSTLFEKNTLLDIVPSASELHSYYRYVGSMTTPGCEQDVAWTVFKRMLPISSRQLNALVLKCRFWTGQPMIDNFRPIQPLDGRVVYKSNSDSLFPSLTLLILSFTSYLEI
uniref:Alpha-carbonic anhydrase domain-containing protein n=1 Tax=Periophthalmus magnuspinnatus TaxID=409849 RepID=A0A3B3ZR68_9GOBI